MTTAEATLLDSVLDSLAHLIGGDDHRQGMVWPKARVEAFDGFEILDPRLADDDDFILMGTPNDVPIWPMDARWAAYQGRWIFKRVATLRPRDWRGKLKFVLPRMYEHTEAEVSADGKMLSSTAPIAVTNGKVVNAGIASHHGGGRLVGLPDIYGHVSCGTQAEYFDVCVAHGIELRREYLWSVLLGEAGIPRARFVTDPFGVREAFRLRDLPPGRERRAALRHWVTAHWRKRRDPDAPTRNWVREHLRGATEFAWNGLSCRIEPSREDIRSAAQGGANATP